MGLINFSLILSILSLLSGAIVLLDRCYLERRRGGKPYGKIVEYAHSFFPVFISVLVLRSFLIEPFRIPSGSLEPTLRVGDFVAVNKFAYGFRLPVLEKKAISVSEPNEGDVVVFRWPPDPRYDYIKRVVGRPGDTLTYHNKILTVNGVEAKQTFIKYTTDESSGRVVSEYKETLGSVTHRIYLDDHMSAQDFTLTLPAHQYFMMGDNRDDSADSRFWGFVDESFLRGKAFLVWMSWDSQTVGVRWNRLGRVIH